MGAVELVADAEVIKAEDAVVMSDGVVVHRQSVEDCDTKETQE